MTVALCFVLMPFGTKPDPIACIPCANPGIGHRIPQTRVDASRY